MEKTIVIEGMMCGHCSKHVHDALVKLDGVQEVIVSHEAGTAICTLTAEVSNEVLTNTVKEAGYQVVEIR